MFLKIFTKTNFTGNGKDDDDDDAMRLQFTLLGSRTHAFLLLKNGEMGTMGVAFVGVLHKNEWLR